MYLGHKSDGGCDKYKICELCTYLCRDVAQI